MKTVRAVVLAAIVVFSVIGGTVTFSGAATAASATLSVANPEAGVTTTHTWSVTGTEDREITVDTLVLDYQGTGTDFTDVSKSDITARVDTDDDGDLERALLPARTTTALLQLAVQMLRQLR